MRDWMQGFLLRGYCNISSKKYQDPNQSGGYLNGEQNGKGERHDEEVELTKIGHLLDMKNE